MNLIVFPAGTSVKEIISYGIQGVIFSNGTGDPKSIPEVAYTARELIQEKLPVFGICLGHQIIGLPLGFDSYKMKFGHRGFKTVPLKLSKPTQTSSHLTKFDDII